MEQGVLRFGNTELTNTKLTDKFRELNINIPRIRQYCIDVVEKWCNNDIHKWSEISEIKNKNYNNILSYVLELFNEKNIDKQLLIDDLINSNPPEDLLNNIQLFMFDFDKNPIKYKRSYFIRKAGTVAINIYLFEYSITEHEETFFCFHYTEPAFSLRIIKITIIL